MLLARLITSVPSYATLGSVFEAQRVNGERLEINKETLKGEIWVRILVFRHKCEKD